MAPIRWIIPLLLCVSLFAVAGVSGKGGVKRVVCYYTNWSAYRPGSAKFLPANINPYLCTHLIYAFGGFTNDFALRPFDKWQDIDQGGYAKFNGLKAHNKNLKTLLAIGGWNEGSARFSKLVADPEARQNLVKSAIKYLRQHGFDGLDLDWEYPASREGSKEADRANYAQLVKELREGFNNEKGNRERLLLTMAVPAGVDTIEAGYDIRSLNRDLDFINILTYDYHTSNEPQVNHHAPLKPRSDLEDDEFDPNEELNVDSTVQLYLLNGATADKLVVGIPTYGRAFKLGSLDLTAPGSPAEGPAEAGKATREKGYLAYYEICEKIAAEDWIVEKPDPEAVGPYAFKGDEWVGYDDEEAVMKKAQYVRDQELGGIMFWSIDNDDFRGTCTGRKYPLIEAAKAALHGTTLGEIPAGNQVSSDDSQSVNRKSSSGTNTLIRPSSQKQRTSSSSSSSTSRTTAVTRRPATTTESSDDENFNPFTTPEPPTTPGSVDFECKDEGFFPNPKDCKKYFWCLESGAAGMVSHVFTCPSGLFFNKFTDSCDYATNVMCKTGTASTTTTTMVPKTTTTMAPKTTTTRTTTTTATPRVTTRKTMTRTTTTTTPEPEQADYEDEVPEEPSQTKSEDEEAPEELQQLLQLISDLGGVDAVKALLERKAGRGRKEDGTQIRLSSAQRQALERVIRPTLRGRVVADEPIPSTSSRPSSNRQQQRPNIRYSVLQRQRGGQSSLKDEETTIRALPLGRGRISTTTSTTTPAWEDEPDTADYIDRMIGPQEEEDEAPALDDDDDDDLPDSAPLSTSTTTTTTTTTTTPAPTTRRMATRKRPLTSKPAEGTPVPTRGAASTTTTTARTTSARRFTTTTTPSTTASSITTTTTTQPTPRAPIVIAIPAPITRPVEEFRKSVASPDQDDIDGTAEVIQQQAVGHNSAGNVVEIDEDGQVYCYDVGNFAYPDDCRKFVQCARQGDSNPIAGWVHTCPKALSFDPVGASCNWGSPVRCRRS